MSFLSLLAVFHLSWPWQGCFGPVCCVWWCFHKRSGSFIKPTLEFLFVPTCCTFYPNPVIKHDLKRNIIALTCCLNVKGCWLANYQGIIFKLDKVHSLFTWIKLYKQVFVREDHPYSSNSEWSERIFCGQRQCPFSLSKGIDRPDCERERWVKVRRNQSRQHVVF